MVDTAVDGAEAGLGLFSLRWARFHDRKRASDSAHGSAVAGLMAGRPEKGVPGLLPNSTVFAADVFRTTRSGNSTTTAAFLAQGIDWLIARDVDVINISVAGPENALVENAVKAAMARNIPIVASAGNDGPNANPTYPAAYTGVIAVTAVDSRMRHYRSANRGGFVTIAAPGVGVWTPSKDGGEYRNGTSYASPFVSAVVAALRHGRDLSVKELRRELAARTLDLGPPGRDPMYGWGLVKGQDICR
jgi:subtilisin family serine protease